MQLRPEEISSVIKAQIKNYDTKIEQSETGRIILIGDGIARASGLEKCMANELVEFANGEYGMALNLEENSVSIVMLGSDKGVREGDIVKRTGKVVSVPVGEALIGRVVNALGQPVDGKVRTETVAEYAPLMPQVGQLDYIRNVSFLQANAYELDGVRIVAAFNTWDLGEAFFTLMAEGLSGRYTVVSDDGTLWAKAADETAWTADELAKGVFVSVGAARTRVFEIVHEDQAGPTAPKALMTSAAVRRAYDARKADLAEKAAADRRLAKVEGIYSDQR